MQWHMWVVLTAGSTGLTAEKMAQTDPPAGAMLKCVMP